jgi:putative ABC transport system permease protein
MATSELRRAIDVHVEIFIVTLVALAVLMAVVGVLGLASTMSIAVTERTREYGVMQVVGAAPWVIRRLVITESVLTGAVGCVLAIALGIPLSMVVGDFLGRLSFGLPLPTQVSAVGLASWVVLAVAGAGAAALTAAQRAARLTVRETLTHQ